MEVVTGAGARNHWGFAIATIRLLLPRDGLRRWHKSLADGLAASGHRVLAEPRHVAAERPASLALVETLEDLLYRRGRPGASDCLGSDEWPPNEAARGDLVFDLTGAHETQRGAIVPLYDGWPGEAARDAALLAGRAPEIELALVDGDKRHVLARGLPALERPTVLRFARDAVASRVATLALAVASKPGCGVDRARAASSSPAPTPPLPFFAASLAAAARRKLRKLVAHEDHWRIAVRPLAPGVAPETTLDRLGDPQWRWAGDDRRRYFADPFLFEADGVAYVFCEEFPYATQKGVISVFTLDAQGVASPARVVLERPYHLSYPVVFRHEGHIFMMPESCANRSLEIYRADPFPFSWTLDRVVLSGVDISDATAFPFAGSWWLTGATNAPGTSTWDCLSLFTGNSPVGPWTPSGDGPVLVDASAARPAGRIFRHGEELWRPAQDCTRGYGSGLALCRVDAVGPGVLEQTVMRRYRPKGGLHTFNASERFVAIDGTVARAKSAWFDGMTL
ncbi:MAG TPA: hypothetical protein VGH40_10985 [Roseiarcus sp.]|jgi:hypothetical protein